VAPAVKPQEVVRMKRENQVDTNKKYVRVTGCRAKDFIEFDFAIGSPDLFVELILPEAAFSDFCRQNDVVLLPSGVGSEVHDALEWRLRDAVGGLAKHQD
jgi:phenol hydroxylase P0 protein